MLSFDHCGEMVHNTKILSTRGHVLTHLCVCTYTTVTVKNKYDEESIQRQ